MHHLVVKTKSAIVLTKWFPTYALGTKIAPWKLKYFPHKFKFCYILKFEVVLQFNFNLMSWCSQGEIS